MPFQANIIGRHSPLAHSQLNRLLHRLFDATDAAASNVAESSMAVRLLSGGYSGAIVMLVWMRHTGAFIAKAGPSPRIAAEHENRKNFGPTDTWLVERRLDGVIGPVEIISEERSVEWSILCYRAVAGKDFSEVTYVVDFSEFARDYVSAAEPDLTPAANSLRTCFDRVVEFVSRGGTAAPEVEGRSLASFLPELPWDAGVRPALLIASALCPDLDELRDFPTWYHEAAASVQIAPVADERRLHGDARLSNILVNRVTAEVNFIDFGNSRTGHVFTDLARFELDLILSTAPRHTGSNELVQDELLDTFGHALREGLGLHDVETQSRHLRCLRMWRQSMTASLSLGTSLPGAPTMYRWFMLAECLRRLKWVANNGEAAAGVDAPSLLRLICALRNRSSAARGSAVAPVASPSDGLRALHCVAAYAPVDGLERSMNTKRNQAKRAALALAAERASTVRVIAESGYSYLAARGTFGHDVRDLLQAGGVFQVVICNPSFIEAYAISSSYEHEPQSFANLPAQATLHVDVLDKFRASIRGYEELQAEYKGRVDLRFAYSGIGATVLLADEMCFYEPYFRNPRWRRERLQFDSFELQFRRTSLHVRTLLEQTFDFHWRHSEPFQPEELREARWGPLRQQMFQMLATMDPSLPRPRSPSSPSTTAG